MIKMTKLGSWNSIQNYTGKLLESFGYELGFLQDATAKNYMMKSVLLMGEVDLEMLNEILPKVRRLVYVGSSDEVKEAITKFCIEKDIPEAMRKSSFTSEVVVYRNHLKQYEIYSSNIFSEMELAAQYLAHCGSKIKNLIKYISQVEMERDSAPFDVPLAELELMHRDFVQHYEECEKFEKNFDQDYLLEIYELYKPT